MIRRILLYSLQLALVFGARAQRSAQPVRETAAMPLSAPALGPVEIEHLDSPGTNVAQDLQGFMWFGTFEGLIRYDGYDFTLYSYDPQDSTSLPGYMVHDILVDADSTLWVGTFGSGLGRLDASTETFVRYRHDESDPTSLSEDHVIVMLEDSRGTLWVGTHGGLNRFDRETGTFTRYQHDPADPTSLSCDQVRALYEDRQGTLWVGTGSPTLAETPAGEGGLNRFDPATGTFTRFLPKMGDPTSLINSKVVSLYEDSRGVFYVGTWGDGLHTMNRETGTFTRHRYDPDDPTKLSRPHLAGSSPVDEGCVGWNCGGVSFIHEDRQGLLWVGGFGGGVNRYDVETGAMSHHEALTDGLVDNTFWDLFEAHDGTFWIGTFSGVYKVVSSVNAFPHVVPDPINPNGLGGQMVTSFLEDRDGVLWIGSWGQLNRLGLDRLDPSTGTLTHFHQDPDSVGVSGVGSLYEDQDGALWVGHDGGVSRLYDRRAGRFTNYWRDQDVPAGHRVHGGVYSLLEDHEGGFWVGTSVIGLDRLDRATGTTTHHRYDPDDPGSLSGDIVLALYEDRRGTLWVGTFGLNRLVEAPEATFTVYLPGRIVTSIYEDRAGRFWVGTWGDGLHLFNRETGESVRYGPEQGLASAQVAALLEDDDGHLWISTAEGIILRPVNGRLSRLDPETGTFTNFGPQDGLPNIGFHFGSATKSRDGTLFFGGNGGFTYFNPKAIRVPVPRPPKMALTALRVFNDEVAPGPEAPLKRPIRVAEEIRLPHAQNDFTLDYTTFSFRDLGRVQYHYRLEGHDAEWISARSQRSARYSGLVPGSYVFRVRAVDSRGVHSVEDASIRVVILPPWWRTPWAYALYGLLILAGVFAIARTQRRRLVRRERQQAQRREAELLRAHEQELQAQNALLEEQKQRLVALDAVKSRFFANVSHEFRTPLTLLVGPLRDLLRGQIGEGRLAEQAPMMYRSAKRLLRLINQLLDLSKLESGTMQLYLRRLDLIDFLRGLVLAFSARAEREGVALSFSAEAASLPMAFDPDKLEKVISNLLSNAFKFASRGGKILVSVEAEHGEALITVKDTGRGIPKEELAHIFDRFYQVDGSAVREHEGTGIGLALTKELVELHKGSISVKSELGFGTTFTLRLPDHQEVQETSVAEGEQEQEDWFIESADLGEVEAAPVAEGTSVSSDAPVILVVEDNPDVRAYLKSHLGGSYRVVEARDGEEGFEQAKSHQPDLVLADVMMPKQDGYALCRAIKSDPDLSPIPVVLLTAKADLESKLEGLETGADDYLPKPFDAEELLLRVENLIEIRRRLRRRFSGEVIITPSEVVVSSADADFLEQVREVVEACLGETNFGVERLAEEVGLSVRQLHRRMKALTKLTSAGYIRMMRLERAAQLLARQAGNVSEVAYAVGFQDAYYFSRLFKQTFGVVPSELLSNPDALSASA